MLFYPVLYSTYEQELLLFLLFENFIHDKFLLSTSPPSSYSKIKIFVFILKFNMIYSRNVYGGANYVFMKRIHALWDSAE